MKLITITLGFCRSDVLNAAMQRYYATAVLPSDHYLVLHHYPIDYYQNLRGHIATAEKFGLKMLMPPKSLGAHGGCNWAIGVSAGINSAIGKSWMEIYRSNYWICIIVNGAFYLSFLA